ncbi:hypothetical protein L7F22_005664 [Adiantum nelumboides]|nr:hypothetical protein [Adiantum nelumboides]
MFQPVLVLPDLSKPFEVHCDASGDCLGAVLLQEGHAIAYESRRLHSDEQSLSIYEKELLAVMHALDTWKHYLFGTPFIIRTDHQSLKYFMTQTKIYDKQLRWVNFLSQFHFHIAHIPGKHNQVADALSRRPRCNAVSVAFHNDLTSMVDEYATDPNFCDVMSAIALGKTQEPDVVQDGYLLYGSWLCVTKNTLGIWQAADAVCFDVDSTVCTDEGIDALGEFCGAGEAVAAWTSRAMGGSVPFQEALAARLALFKPSLKDVEGFLANNPPKISPGIEELIRKLHAKGKSVYLISGGFRQMIAPVAKILHIREDNIFANRLLFSENGSYSGFDVKEPTSKSSGKAAAIAHLKQKFGYQKLVMIGDGATDLEARQPGGADIFICYGGVQFRANVAAQADWCVLNFRDLIESL